MLLGRRFKMARRNPEIRARSAGLALAGITRMQTRIGVAFWMVFAVAGCDSAGTAVALTDSGRDATFEVGSGGPDSGPDLADAVRDVVAPEVQPDAEAGVGAEADVDADASAGAPCLGVCASGPSFGCARTYATPDCFQHTCCELPDDGGPP